MNYIEANLVTLPNPVPVGLCETVRAAGYGLEGHNGQYYSDNASAAQTIINGFTAAQSLAFAQQAMLDALAAQWWAAVSGGHTTAAGIPCKTDPTSLALINGAYNRAQSGAQASFNFVDANGAWHTLAAADMIALFNDVSGFLQNCFNYRQTLSNQIMVAADPSSALAINVTSGWPT